MKIVRWLVLLIGVLVVAVGGAVIAARLSDGPVGPFAGGAFRSGELVEEEVVDWSFAGDIQTVELQLSSPARSRTTWILEREGQAYIPCGFPNYTLWKKWPYEALVDGRALVRIEGELYPVELTLLEDAELHRVLRTLIEPKYGTTVPGGPEAIWFFELAPRAE